MFFMLKLFSLMTLIKFLDLIVILIFGSFQFRKLNQNSEYGQQKIKLENEEFKVNEKSIVKILPRSPL